MTVCRGALWGGASLIAIASVQAPAFAQDNTADDVGIQEIVVTAQKRTESAQDIPLTVAAVSGETLAEGGVKDLVGAVQNVPGVVFGRAPDDGLALTFRGLGTVTRSQAFELSQALFVDGVFMGKARLYTTSVFDVERMEFIKGTQSTLLGKNASLGAISIIPRQPGDVFAVDGRFTYEFENGGYIADLGFDAPLGDDTAIRLAGHYNDLDGQITNTVTGKDLPVAKDLGLRAIVHSNPLPDLDLTASYQFANNRRIGVNYFIVGDIPSQYGSGKLDGDAALFTTATANGDAYHRTRSHVASFKAELNLGNHTLISQTSYVHYKLKFIDDFDFSIDDAINFFRNENYRQFSQELRLQSDSGGALEYMVGAYYLDAHWRSDELQGWAVPDFPPPPDPTSGQLFNGAFDNLYLQDSQSLSAFASGTYHISDALRISAGARISHETKDVVFGREAVAPITIWNSIANPPFDPTALKHNSTFFDGNVSLQYDVTPDVMLYASYGHGSKSGGFTETNTVAIPPDLLVDGKVPAALVQAGTEIKDEFASTYEAGVKATLANRRLLLNLSGFWTHVKDFQDTVFTGGPLGFITFNGPARARGFELETSYNPFRGLRFNASATYSDTTSIIQPIDANGFPAVDESGNPVLERFRRSQAPKLVVNASADYEVDLNDDTTLNLGVSMRHRSKIYNQRQEMFPSNALTTVDLSAGLEFNDGLWGIDLRVKNVTNEIEEDFASPTVDPRFGAFYGAHMAGPTPSRTILGTIKFSY